MAEGPPEDGPRIDGASLWIEPGIRVTFQRMPQVDRNAGPVSMRSYGALPLAAVRREILLPVAPSEAFWIGFDAKQPDAALGVRIAVAGDGAFACDALTGGPWLEAFGDSPRNYVVCPPQRAIDGVTAPGGTRPFARTTGLPGHYHPLRNLTVVTRRLRQRLGTDAAAGAHALEWGNAPARAFTILLVSFERFEEVTGRAPPALDSASIYGGWRLP